LGNGVNALIDPRDIPNGQSHASFAPLSNTLLTSSVHACHKKSDYEFAEERKNRVLSLVASISQKSIRTEFFRLFDTQISEQ
jgi:hypothetical protein